MWGWDRKIRSSRSPFAITRQASWCQSVILGTDFSIPLSPSWWILTVSASLVMPIGDPRDGFFYPTLTLMMDFYSLRKPRDANRWSMGGIFLSHSHTHDGFLYSRQASWCQSMIFGTDFSIPPSHCWWILIVSASLVMPIGDPWDGFFYPTLILMMDTYSLGKPLVANRWSSGQIFYPTLTLMMDSYSLGKPLVANRWSSGQIFLSHPHTHDGFL